MIAAAIDYTIPTLLCGSSWGAHSALFLVDLLTQMESLNTFLTTALPIGLSVGPFFPFSISSSVLFLSI